MTIINSATTFTPGTYNLEADFIPTNTAVYFGGSTGNTLIVKGSYSIVWTPQLTYTVGDTLNSNNFYNANISRNDLFGTFTYTYSGNTISQTSQNPYTLNSSGITAISVTFTPYPTYQTYFTTQTINLSINVISNSVYILTISKYNWDYSNLIISGNIKFISNNNNSYSYSVPKGQTVTGYFLPSTGTTGSLTGQTEAYICIWYCIQAEIHWTAILFYQRLMLLETQVLLQEHIR